MKRFTIICYFASIALLAAEDTNSPAAVAERIARGRYLVEDIGMCGDCHSPRNANGEFDRSQWLQGELIDFKPDHPKPFAAIAPPIAGMPGYGTDALATRFLETGTNAQGSRAMAPMPQFRFNHEDALAVVAYLRSLKH